MEQQETNQSQINLSLADITLALQIVQVAAQRGAFKPEEFEEVGGCYNRILSFLEASGAIQRTSTEAGAASNEVESLAEATAAETKPAAKKTTATKAKGKK